MLPDLNAQLLEARQGLQDLRSEVFRLEIILKLKDEQIRLLNIRLWGPKADKLSEAQLALLPQELIVATLEVERVAALPEPEKSAPALPKAKAPRAHHPGRAALPAHLERREKIIPCHPKDCACPNCGAPRPVIGYEIREELGCEPARFFVVVI
jgi:transposase